MKIHRRVKVPLDEGRFAEVFVDISQIRDRGVEVYKSNSSVGGLVYVTVKNALKKGHSTSQDPRAASLEAKAMFDLYENNYRLRRDFVIYMVERRGFNLRVVMSCRYTPGRRDMAEKAYFYVDPEYEPYFNTEDPGDDFDIPF